MTLLLPFRQDTRRPRDHCKEVSVTTARPLDTHNRAIAPIYHQIPEHLYDCSHAPLTQRRLAVTNLTGVFTVPTMQPHTALLVKKLRSCRQSIVRITRNKPPFRREARTRGASPSAPVHSLHPEGGCGTACPLRNPFEKDLPKHPLKDLSVKHIITCSVASLKKKLHFADLLSCCFAGRLGQWFPLL